MQETPKNLEDGVLGALWQIVHGVGEALGIPLPATNSQNDNERAHFLLWFDLIRFIFSISKSGLLHRLTSIVKNRFQPEAIDTAQCITCAGILQRIIPRPWNRFRMSLVSIPYEPGKH
jgi:hypothetical protein